MLLEQLLSNKIKLNIQYFKFIMMLNSAGGSEGIFEAVAHENWRVGAIYFPMVKF